jgi:hypothetical protein
MNSLYTKAIIFLAAIAVIVVAVFGVLWQNNRTIERAGELSYERAAELFGKQRAEDELAHERELQRLRNEIEAARAESRQRIQALDVTQRRRTDEVLSRINSLPDNQVGEQLAAVLEESYNRWPE